MNLPIGKVSNLYYKKGLSTREVGEMLDASVRQVIRFMEKNGLARRKSEESNLLKFLRQKPSFNLKSALTNKEEKLQIAGLMLYWGEGAKTGQYTVDLANSNPLIIKLFVKMLREIYNISEERLRVLLYCYANQNVQRLISYWVKITGISQKQFSKPYVRQDFLEEKKNKMPHGLIHIRYNDKKLLTLIRSDIEKLVIRFIELG
ncbi:hypothetical protein HY388_00990 [Candidatus Daviesbacteria bacterium]|nr:hypothetical protein [Candidatus Daviesbacteria bacterium]